MGCTDYWQNGVGLYQDSAATTPATANAASVGCWRPVVGTHDLTAAGTVRPTLTAATPYKAKPGVSFDRTNSQKLTSATFNATSNVTEGCWLIAFYRPQLAQNQGIIGPTGDCLALLDDGSGSLALTTSGSVHGITRDDCFHGKAIIAVFDGAQAAANRLQVRNNRTQRTVDLSLFGNNPPAATPTVAAGLDIGSYEGGFYFTGTILEMAYLPRKPTPTEIAAVEAYWGQTFFDQGQNKVHVLGDSIPFGYPIHNADHLNWPEQLDGLLDATWDPTQNVSIVGYTIAAIEGSGGNIDYDRDEWRTRDVVILEAGTNDGAQSRTAAQALTDMTASVTKRHLFGFETWVQTLPYADGAAFGTAQTAAGYEAFRQAYNSGIRAGSTGADRVLDVAARPGWTLPINTAFYTGDRVHLDTAGHTDVAQAAYDLINGITPPAPTTSSFFGKLTTNVGPHSGSYQRS